MDAEQNVKAVIGVPLFNGQQRGHLQEAVFSLLKQTYPHVAFIFLDDCSTDNTVETVSALTAGHPRVRVERNERRLGLVANWRRVFERGRELFPEAMYFAWGSDHDRWHERWLERLAAELDAHPGAVMAYPRFVRISNAGEEITHAWPLSPRREFIPPTTQKIGAGNLVYGLYRTMMLHKAGIFPRVYRPDVYVITELSLYGELRFVPETLWFRRERPADRKDQVDASSSGPRAHRDRRRPRHVATFGTVIGVGPVSRQHSYMFPEKVPLYARLPSATQHAALLFWRLSVRGHGRPLVTRMEGAKLARRLLRSAE